ncbi:MAG: hypothetical protein RL033_204 [Pseudomonadota bacterium]
MKFAAFSSFAAGSVALGVALAVLSPSLGCSGSAEPAAEPRYPEKRRPPPLRSASDGEIMGADGVPPEDRLEASPTNQHPAAGWVVEEGKLVPEKEARQRAAAHERSGFSPEGKKTDPDCEPAGTAAAGAPAPSDGRKRKTCPVVAPQVAP